MADERRDLDRLLAAVEGQLAALLAPLARDLAALVRRAPRDGSGQPTAAGRLGIDRWLASALAALFGGSPAGAEAKYGEAGTVSHLIAQAATGAARAGAAPIVADAARRLAGQPALLAALASPTTGGGGGRPTLDPTRSWVDPNGHRLSDRVWRSGAEVRARIDAVLDYGLRNGASAVDIASALEGFLTPEGRERRVLVRGADGKLVGKTVPIATRTPYGTSGLYSPRRLARTEVTRAYGAATIEAARSSPFVRGVRWRLSAAHPESDQCDVRAAEDRHGLGPGVYRADAVPTYPDHPQCLCALLPVTVESGAYLALLAGPDRAALPLDEATIAAAVAGF